jgi:hypothetical protein
VIESGCGASCHRQQSTFVWDDLIGRTPLDAPRAVRPYRGNEAHVNTSSETTPWTKIEVCDLKKDIIAGKSGGAGGDRTHGLTDYEDGQN